VVRFPRPGKSTRKSWTLPRNTVAFPLGAEHSSLFATFPEVKNRRQSGLNPIRLSAKSGNAKENSLDLGKKSPFFQKTV
jgi:hypothetical protein